MNDALSWVLVVAALVWIGCALAVQYHPRARRPTWTPPDPVWWPEWYAPRWRYEPHHVIRDGGAGELKNAYVQKFGGRCWPSRNHDVGTLLGCCAHRIPPRPPLDNPGPIERIGPRLRADPRLSNTMLRFMALRPGAQDAVRWNIDGSRRYDPAAEEAAARRLIGKEWK